MEVMRLLVRNAKTRSSGASAGGASGADGRASAEGGASLELAELRARVAAGLLLSDDLLCLEGHDFWAPAAAWAALNIPVDPPPRHTPERLDAPEAIAGLDGTVRDALRWWLREGGRARGPLTTHQLRAELAEGIGASMLVALVGGDCWFPPAVLAERASWRAQAESAVSTTPCPICLERIPCDSKRCPECSEPVAPSSSTGSSLSGVAVGGARSIPRTSLHDRPTLETRREPGFMKLHWRPLVTAVAVGGLLAAGVTLRHLAPEKYQPPERMAPQTAAAEPSCEISCWDGEACQMGQCVWQPSNELGHVDPDLTIAGPFELPGNVADVIALDGERFAASHLLGVQVMSARTGATLSLVSDAPHAQGLFRVGDVFYAASPRQLYVVDVASTRVLKAIEVGYSVSDVAVGASGQRVLASMPGAKSVAVISTDYHAEVARFFFGDDHVRAVALAGSGDRALVTNGHVPLLGLSPSREADRQGAMYAFDPSLLPSEQDKIRTGLVGNPVDVVTTPDEARSSYVILREKDTVVRLERLPNGALRQNAHWKTCRQPEELAFVGRGRKLVVRCNLGRAIEVFDLDRGELAKHIPLNARISDMVVSPDGRQVLLALPRDGENGGALGLVDLDDYSLSLHELGGEPHRLRITPDGRTAVAVSDRSKVAWVIH